MKIFGWPFPCPCLRALMGFEINYPMWVRWTTRKISLHICINHVKNIAFWKWRLQNYFEKYFQFSICSYSVLDCCVPFILLRSSITTSMISFLLELREFDEICSSSLRIRNLESNIIIILVSLFSGNAKGRGWKYL